MNGSPSKFYFNLPDKPSITNLICLSFIFFIISFQSRAQFTDNQQYFTDSLQGIIDSPESHDTTIVMTLLWMANVHHTRNLDTAILICKKAQKLSGKIAYKTGLSKSYGWLGYLHSQQGDFPKALDNLHKCIAIRKEIGDKEGMATASINIGALYKRHGEIPKALGYYNKALTIHEDIGNKKGIAICLNNLGTIYDDQGEIALALEYYLKSLAIEKELGNKSGMGDTYVNIGHVYLKNKDTLTALNYYYKGLNIQEEIDNKRSVAICQNNIGGILCNRDSIKKGLLLLEEALSYFSKSGIKEWEAFTHHKIGSYAFKAGDNQKASYHAQQAMNISQTFGFTENIKRAARLLTSVNKKEGNWLEALKNYELYIDTRDSLLNEKTQKATIKQEIQHQYEKQAQVDSIKTAEEKKVTDAQLAAQDAQIKQEVTQRYALYGGLGFLFLFGGFMYNRFRVTNKQKSIITKQKTEVEKQKLEADYQREVVEEKNKEIMDSITYARRLQEAILPPKALVKEWLPNSFILYKPKDIVAGDFYWMESIPKAQDLENAADGEVIYFAVADCTGHGVPGAMVSVVCSHALSKALIEENITEPARILDRTRELVIERFEKSEEEVKDGMDISLCSLNMHTKQIQWAGANNPLWIINPNRTKWPTGATPFKNIEGGAEVKANKQPIGKYATETPFTNHTIQLQKDDTLFLFSDGFVDQFGGKKGKKFKSANFKKLLLNIYKEPMQKQRELINSEFEEWIGDTEQVDDICVIGVKL